MKTIQPSTDESSIEQIIKYTRTLALWWNDWLVVNKLSKNIRLCKNYTKVTRGGVMKCHEMSCNVMSGILETMFATFKMLSKIILILFDHKGILCYAKWETAWQSTGWCMGKLNAKALQHSRGFLYGRIEFIIFLTTS